MPVSNTMLTIDMVTRKASAQLENYLSLTRNVNRQYDKNFANEGAKIGTSLRVRQPIRKLVSNGANLAVQDHVEKFASVTITNQAQIAGEFTSAEFVLSMDDFTERFIDPSVSQMAASIDAEVANAYASIGQSVGTPGTTPATSLVIGQAGQKLNDIAAPQMQRYVALNSSANLGIVEGMSNRFNPVDIVSSQIKKGMTASNIHGFDEINMTQSIRVFTTGSRTPTGGTLSASVSVQGATSIAITGAGANATVKRGDVFTVAGCFAVNPQTRESTGSLFQFVALADVTLNGSGAGTLTVAQIYDATHAYATVGTFPASGAAVVFMGAASTGYPQNLAFQKDAIVLATADLSVPTGGVEFVSRQVHNGVSMRILRAYTVGTDVIATRIDVLYGVSVVRPELGVRIWG